MKKITIFLLLGLCFSNISVYAKSNKELEAEIKALEKRIILLENHIIKGTPKANQLPNYKAIWRKLKPGMNEEEVRSLIGEPTSITVYSRSLIEWSYFPGRGIIRFDEKGVFSWDEPNISQ